ncbi:MAG: lysophospholipid acyltransferase family protein [Gammaproteobacteria bacterium]|nr:lysophospholipid acyltransferase family protein [Gammaproteobacteria bacterium]
MEENRLPPRVPAWGNALLAWIGRTVLHLYGWSMDVRLPNEPKFVVIAAPHTSNWDFVFGLAAILALRVRINFWGKHTLFNRPFGGLMRWLGGIPVERSSPHGVVGQAVAEFRRQKQLILALAPEGTRKRVDKWRSGFYQVAVGARVPIVLAYIDYRRKRVGTGPVLMPSGDYAADLQKIVAFYRGIGPRHPEQFALPA